MGQRELGDVVTSWKADDGDDALGASVLEHGGAVEDIDDLRIGGFL